MGGDGAPYSDYPVPAVRRFRVYAFDPLASTSLDTAVVNDALLSLPWEEPWEAPLTPGPCGEYLEVIDYDPASGLFYPPVDPNDPVLLAQDGLPPSEGRPQFHQQMVYAVAMKTIRNFERALGRKVLWSDLRLGGQPDTYVARLRVHPHALRERNAYYSPEKKALMFGYFKSGGGTSGLPDGWVFTCLSHDIIAHETTHAILDGVHRRFIESTSLDTLAFHEAFADIVALLQHFTMPEVVEQQLAQVRGRLRSRNLLTGLARQFGDATGRAGALREAIDQAVEGDGGDAPPRRYEDADEPHERGSFLVAAIFDAFVTIFERRTADLIRLAAAQQTVLGEELHPDLVKRLTREAIKAADHILRICVRALDYVPPIDIRFGEFLRAMITADADLVPDDPLHYRLAIAEAFRRRGIFPRGCLSLAPDSLLWEAPHAHDRDFALTNFADLLGRLDLSSRYLRSEIWVQARENQGAVHRWLNEPDDLTQQWDRLLGVILASDAPQTIARTDKGSPRVEVHSVRIARRAGPDGQDTRQLVIEVAQRRRAFFSPEAQARADAGEGDPDALDFWFRGGSTVLVDLRDGRVRFAIRKRINDERRLQEQRAHLLGSVDRDVGQTYFGDRSGREPFAFLHRG